jgi:tetratricopeptide (TPR) repeat protein
VSELLPEVERERTHYARELEERDPVFGRVAILITLTTLLASGTGFLERVAASRQAAADRNARAWAVEAVGTAIASDAVSRERATLVAATDQTDELSGAFDYAGSHYVYGGRPYAKQLNAAYTDATNRLRQLGNQFFGSRYGVHGGFDSISFQEDLQTPRYAAAEWQRAYADERGSWASKRGGLILGIGVFAVALFLLGPTLTVPAANRYVYFGVGAAFAVAAFGFVLYTWFRETEGPSRAAIAAYAHAAAASSAGASNDEIVSAASTAIENRRNYEQAYELRGEGHLGVALGALSGPVDEVGATGTAKTEAAAARDDLRTATRLNRGDYFAWVNLAEALYLLGDYEGAGKANDRALAVEVARPVVNLDRILLLLVTGHRWVAPDKSRGPVAKAFHCDALKWLRHSPLAARNTALSAEERLINLTLYRRTRGLSGGQLRSAASRSRATRSTSANASP